MGSPSMPMKPADDTAAVMSFFLPMVERRTLRNERKCAASLARTVLHPAKDG